MRDPGQPDCFVIVNGPEDGAEFPLLRTPAHVGSDPGCQIVVRLDDDVAPRHALITAVPDGYRVRRLDTKPVLVDGKRAGALRSRVVRAGGTIRVGHTLLAVDCAPDGLARRSRGIMSENDLVWVIREGAARSVELVQRGIHHLFSLFGRLLGSWLALSGLFLLAFVFVRPFRYWVLNAGYWIYYRILETLNSFS